jgi:hypothetical protein
VILLLKLTLAPVLIGLVSLAERKWGTAVSGALVGLPLTSGPVLYFLAIEQGASFSAHTSIGSLLGLIALAGFALVYALVSRSRSWIPCMAAGTAAYIAISMVILEAPLRGAGLAFAVTCGLLLAALRAFPRTLPVTVSPATASAASTREPSAESVGGRELIWRMITAAVLVFLLTAVAPLLGPVASGLVAMFPIYTSILAVFNHLKSGTRAVSVLHGVVTGAFGGAAFFVIVAAVLGRLAIGPCFLLASFAGVAVQAMLLPFLRPSPSR